MQLNDDILISMLCLTVIVAIVSKETAAASVGN